MRKIIVIVLCALLLTGLSVNVLAAPEEPVITMQPQSHYYPEYSVAIYTVKATGTNLSAYWYIEWEGKTYNASQIGGAMQPWEAYAGESYGAKKLDKNTFCFIFQGIEEELSGAELWCEIEDGHYSVPSQVAHIIVGNYGSPPEILDIPASITVQQGDEADIRCLAKSTDGSQLEFLWYETGTGKFEDLQAINRGTEISDYMFCDTSNIGTRYYVCGITTSGGGMAYSSAVEVNVVEKTITVAEPEIQTKTLPVAMVGTQYSFQLKCSDPNAEFFPYYNPGTNNDLEDGSWIGLSIDGWLMGTPDKAGTYSFSVCAMGAGGEDYAVYTLNVVDAPDAETTAPTESVSQTTQAPSETTAPAQTENEVTKAPTPETQAPIEEPAGQQQAEEKDTGLPWWALTLIALVGAVAGVGTAVLLIRKNKK